MTAVDTELDSLEEFIAEQMKLTHIVAPSDNPDICHILGNGPEVTAHDIVAHARLHRIEVTALCGYRWVPINNPVNYETCTACLDEAHRRLAAGE